MIAPEGDGKWVEYAGGYSDMLAQRRDDFPKRGAKPIAKPAAAEKPNLARPATEPARRKLGFNEKHALETLPGRMAVLTAKIAHLQELMDEPTLYARDRAAFDKVSTALAAALAELAESEQRWLELELLRGEIEGT